MNLSGHKESFLLFLGDSIVLFLSLWIVLYLRYGAGLQGEVWSLHIVPFSILFASSILVFFIAGLYERHTSLLKRKIPSIIFHTQVTNTLIAVLFFYAIPYFGITPKTNLFLYIIISSVLIALWRIYGTAFLGLKKPQKALLIGSGQEMKELKQEVNANSQYHIHFVSSIDVNHIGSLDFQQDISTPVYSEEISIVVADLQNEKVTAILPNLYNLIFSRVRFIDMHRVYEDIFNRVPLSLVRHNWFLENISVGPKTIYDFFKRATDICFAIIGLVISLPFYVIAFILIKCDDGGSVFFSQDRIGKNNQIIHIYKFRSMREMEDGSRIVTKVGGFLRKSRIDELPQLWNVLMGDISMIGPRPELPDFVKEYDTQIPYYNIRHLIKPGLSGWAQIYHENHPHHASNVEETRVKLSYDLFYVKNRSFFLDIKIALKTFKILASRAGI